MKERYSYLIAPLNMAYANIDEQVMLVENLKGLADSLEDPIVIDMFREYDDMMFGKKKLLCANEKTVITSKSQIGHLLHQANFEHEQIPELKFQVKDTAPSYLTLENGMHARCYSLYSTPNKLDAGWIYRIFQYCDFVRIFVRPVNPSLYVSMLRGSIKTAHLSAKKDTIDGSAMIEVMKDKVLSQNQSQIVSVRVVFGVLGSTRGVLEERAKRFCSKAKAMRATLRHLPYSDETFLHAGRTDIYVETDSLHPIFPFISSELSEKGGTAWGLNVVTKRAVLYDYKKRRNYNVGIVATSGAGKSHTIKIIVSRAQKKYSDAFFFFVDIENEYVEFGRRLGFSISEIDINVELGMDPFNYMSRYKAASLLADVLGVQKLTRYAMLRAGEDLRCISTQRMIEIIAQYDGEEGTEHAKYMQILQMGPIRSLLAGMPSMSNSSVIALANSFAVNSDEHRLATRISLEFALQHATKLPKIIPKFVVLDEGWALFKDESTGESVEELARRARKYNVIIILATQNIEDVLKHAHALTLFNNSDTKIFLQHKANEQGALVDVLHLSEFEARILVRAKKGEAMVHASENVVRCQFIADEKEMELFNTDPNEP